MHFVANVCYVECPCLTSFFPTQNTTQLQEQLSILQNNASNKLTNATADLKEAEELKTRSGIVREKAIQQLIMAERKSSKHTMHFCPSVYVVRMPQSLSNNRHCLEYNVLWHIQ